MAETPQRCQVVVTGDTVVGTTVVVVEEVGGEPTGSLITGVDEVVANSVLVGETRRVVAGATVLGGVPSTVGGTVITTTIETGAALEFGIGVPPCCNADNVFVASARSDSSLSILR